MTLSPPELPADLAVSPPQSVAAIFDAAQKPAQWLEGDARIAIHCPSTQVVYATSAALELFGAKDRAELASKLLRGEGPSARRLRFLAAALPVGAAMRLERLRIFVGPKPASRNLRCARIATNEGAIFLLLSAGAWRQDTPRPAQPAAPAVAVASPKARFLWTLDAEGRFGEPHPMLAAAVGANAPRRGERLDDWRFRTGMDLGGELARVLAERATFSELAVAWPVAGGDRRLRIALSAAPTFDRNRGFTGYRGFGVIGEAVDARDRAATDAHGADAVGVAGDARRQDGREDSSPGLVFDSWQIPADPVSAVSARFGIPPRGELPTEADGAVAEEASQQPSGADPGPEPVEVSWPSGSDPLAASTGDAAASPSDPWLQEVAAHGAASAAPEHSAEIYVLRQSNASPPQQTKVVPIRPSAIDHLSPRDRAQASPSDSVELSTSERNAFREIAHALVGRAPASRDDPSGEVAAANPVADVRDLLDHAFAAPSAPPPDGSQTAAPFADDETARRNAGAILDRLPTGVLVARDARALYLNRTLLDLAGYADLAHFQTADGLATIFRGRDPQSMPPRDGGALTIVSSDGQSIAVDGHAQSIVWDDGPATLFTLRRSSERELATQPRAPESGARARSGATEDLQEMLDRATDGAITLDSAARIVSINRPGERLFGYNREEIAGESVLMLLAPHSHAEVTSRLESLSRADEAEAPVRQLQVAGRDKNGVALALTLTLARIGPADAPGYCALWRDLTREREAERRLTSARDIAQDASARKTDFLAKVSHEIRTPLHAILGMAEVMIEERFGTIGNERYKDYLKDIYASGKHVMSLADDLLDLSKIESGKLELAFVPVDANRLIRECVSLMQPQAARERIIMRVSLFDRLPSLMVDERSLRQIMLNLVSNALKFNQPGGQVIVSTAVDAIGQAVIRVRDTGVGMNENEVALALEPFSTASQRGGAGIGLPLTKSLVEANKAEFSIKSRREQGTLVEIAFPKMQAAQ